MSVDTVVRSIQFTFKEPRNVTMLKAAVLDGLKVLVPGKEFMCEVTKELVRVLDRLFVHFLVVFIVVDMWLSWVLAVRYRLVLKFAKRLRESAQSIGSRDC